MRSVILCSHRIDGGGNQSGKKLAKLLDYDFVNLHTDEWKDCKAENQVWYMNDDIYRLQNNRKEFYKVLSYAKDIKIVYNFVVANGWKEKWLLDYPVSKVLFLNQGRLKEWEEKTVNSRHSLIPVKALCPPINYEDFKEINRVESDKLRIGRHSRISLKYTKNPEELYKKLDKEGREFYFQITHPDIKKEFKDNARFIFTEWNEKPVKQFLEGIDIWLSIINPNTKDQGPRVLAEAMLAGCCCITEDRDGMQDKIINGVTGYLVKNEEEAIKIVDMLDTKLIKIIGDKAREYALRHFNPVNWIKELT